MLTYGLAFVRLQTLLLKRKMGAKKGRRVSKIEVPTYIHTEFELGDTAADIQRRREKWEQREREEEAQKQKEERQWKETTHSGEGMARKSLQGKTLNHYTANPKTRSITLPHTKHITPKHTEKYQ